MQTRSSLRLVSNPSSNPTPSTNPNPNGRNRRRSKQRIEEFNLEELSPPIVMMADQRTMAQLLQAPTEGYEDAIFVPAITANNFELKHGLLTLVQNKQFFGHDKEDPHAHIPNFNKITSTLKFLNVLNTSINLMLFPFSLEGAARIWLKKEPPRSIFTWNDLVSKFINQFFPPSKTTNLRNEITNFQQHQNSLNSAAGGNFLDKMPRECLAIIESKSKVRYSRNKPVIAKVSTNTSTSGISPDVAELKDMVKALLIDKKSQNQALVTVKAVEKSSYQAPTYQALSPQTQGVSNKDFSTYVKANDPVMRNMKSQGQNMQNQLTNLTELLTKFMNSNSASTLSSGTLPSNTIANSRSDLKAITTRSGVSYDGPQILPSPSFLPKVVENKLEMTKDTVHPTNNGSIEDVQPPVVQSESLNLNSKPIFKDLNFNICFADALILIPKFGPSIKSLLTNKDKLCELARTPLNEHCSAVLLKKLPEKLGDPGKFFIPCDFPRKNKLSLLDLSLTCMTLELTIVRFLVRLGLQKMSMSRRSFLKTGRALITLHVGKEAITFNLDQTSRYSTNYNDITAKRIDVIDMACEEYSNSDFLLEEVDAFLALEDDPTLPEVDQSYLDSEGDILLLKSFLNDDPSLPLQNQGNYLPEVRKELKICKAKSDKSSIDEPPEVELKDFPPHLEYAFLEGDDKLPVIIAKDLSVEEKTALITVLKSHKRAIAWKLSDIKEVLKLLDAGLIYPISDSPWVSLVQCVPKKGGFTVVENEENELIPTRLVTSWRVCIDYRKLNEASRKDHFPLPFMDQMLERLAGNQYYCFLDGFSGYFQIPIDLKDQEKTTFTCPYGTFAYRRMPFRLCNALGTFQRCMVAIFHDMIEKTMEVFMDDFSVFGNSFQSCLSHLEKMLKRCEDTNLCLNWEKSHFMVKEGIVLDHKISKEGIEVDKAKVDVITKLPHPTTIKDRLIAELRSITIDLVRSVVTSIFVDLEHYTQTEQQQNKESIGTQELSSTRSTLEGVFTSRIISVGNKMHKAFPLPVIEFPLAEEVPTASEESCHCQKKREATAKRIALLVIEFRDSYEVPVSTASFTTTDTTSGGTGKKSGRTVTLTAEDMQKRNNDVKARTTLLLSLPDEYQLRFSKYKTTQELWAAILKTFDGNEATKKTKKNLLKQQYGDFKSKGLETLEHKKSKPNSQNMAFISLAKHSRGNEDVNTASVSTASTNVPTASANIEVASISQDIACTYIASQSSGSQIKFNDINQIDEDDMEEMDIKWIMALLSMRADKFWKKTMKKISIQGSDVAGFDKSKDWSYMANDEEDHTLVANEKAPTEFALMANTSAESKVFYNSLCSKDCKKNNDSLNSKITDLTDKLFDAKNMIYHYKLGFAQVESRLVEHKDREIKYCEKIRGLEFRTESNNDYIEILKKELETLKKEKERVDGKLEGFLTASKDLDNLIESQRSDKNKEGLGYSVVPPPPAQIYSSPKKDLSWTGLLEFPDDTVTDYSRPSHTMESTSSDDQNRNPSVPETDASPSTITPKPFIKFVKPNDSLSKSKTGLNFFMKKKACFNCGDFNHLAYDCRKRVKRGTSRYQNNTHENFTPRSVVHRPYRPPVKPMRINMNGARPNGTSFNKHAHSYPNRLFQRTSVVRSQFRAPWVPTANRNFPPVSRKLSTVSRNFSTINRKFPTTNRKFSTSGTKFSTADTGKKGKAACSQNNIDEKGYWDSSCSRNMTGNISYLSDYEPFDGGYVSFGQGGCKITRKGTIKTGKLKFENVYFVKDLKYNLFSVSQICDNKNSVMFTDSECIVLEREFKLLDDANIFLRNPRQHNMYSIDLNNIIPHKDLTCLVAKASADECMLWHRRLVTDDFSRFTWTFFLKTKDETSGILKKFITEIENLKDLKVKIIRVLVNKSHNKTPYELFNGRSPAIEFFKPFGCHVMSLNTLDNLGIFEEKRDEGYFIGYLMSSKAFRVFNKRTRRVKENLHVEFLENKAIEKGAGPNWLFDIDSLTKSMNYVPVDASTISTNISGTKDATSQEVKKNVSSLRYIALPNWTLDALLKFSLSKPQDHYSTEVPESSGNTNPTTSTSNPPADQMETLTVKSPIPTVSSPVLTACFTDSPEPSSNARLILKRFANQVETPSLDNILTLTNRFEDILGVTTNLDESNGVEADVSNMKTTITASPTPTLRIHKDHPKSQIIGPVDTPIQTRNKSKEVGEESFIATIHQKTDPTLLQFCLFSCFLSQVEPKKISDALQDPSWVEAMQEELLQFKIQRVWTLVDCPKGDPEYPARVYKVEKAMYGLHEAPRAWYGDILKKFRYSDVRSSNTPMDKENPYGKEGTGKDVDLHLYRSMIGSLMYLTASRPDILFAVCVCARHQVIPKKCHMHAVKRIFRYLKGHPKLGLWYPKESLFDLVAYSDSDYGGATQDRKSTTRGCQFLGRRLISWQCKKQIVVATSTTKAEYVAAASCCGQVL
nr:reverse transcriptase domain-containing protein [Tanacetum cinerariifolium]